MDLITQRLMLKDIMPGLAARSPECAARIKEAYPDGDAPILRRAYVPKDLDFDTDEKAIVGIINSIAKDWYDEVILPEGVIQDYYSGIVLWNHDYMREGTPHARSQWIKPNTKRKPTHLLGKTEYHVELSSLAKEIYIYREKKHPLGQSIGFLPLEWSKKGDTGWKDIYEDWRERLLTWRREQGIPKSSIDVTEPYKIYTRWILLEYSDVLMPANADCVAIAVSNGWIEPDDAKKFIVDDMPADSDIDSPDGNLPQSVSEVNIAELDLDKYSSEELAALAIRLKEYLKPEPNKINSIDPEGLKAMMQDAALTINLTNHQKPITLNFSVDDFLANLGGE